MPATETCGERAVAAFFEAHIEQGPILEAEDKTIGVVQGVQGIRWYEVTVTGQEAHAGPTPMERRKDALVGVSEMVLAVNRIGMQNLPYACATVGMMQVQPEFAERDPGQGLLHRRFPPSRRRRRCRRWARAQGGVRGDRRRAQARDRFQGDLVFAAGEVRDDCVAAVQQATDGARLSATARIVSGAGHDCRLHVAGRRRPR